VKFIQRTVKYEDVYMVTFHLHIRFNKLFICFINAFATQKRSLDPYLWNEYWSWKWW